ncbi:MAG: Bug family tripartite tricarboxylate transporter substrate binding protein [Burkholderiaceae bacterium]
MSMNIARGCRALLVATAMAAVAGGAFAQQEYPSRTVRILSAQTPGGPSDSLIRNVAELLSKGLGQPVVVESRPGAGGMVAGEACARAAADGYTLCFADSFATMLNPHLYANMRYDPLKDFTPIVLLGFIPSGIWVHKDVPANSMTELFELARQKPRQINIASWGRASSPYIYAEYLKRKGIEFTDVPYKAAGDAWRAVLAGEVQFTNYSIMTGMRQGEGRTRLLAVNTDRRIPEFPNVPTFAEIGLPAVQTWFALFAPVGTPAEIVRRVHAEISKSVFQNPEIVARHFTAQGFVTNAPVAAPPDELARYLSAQTKMYESYVEAANIRRQ